MSKEHPMFEHMSALDHLNYVYAQAEELIESDYEAAALILGEFHRKIDALCIENQKKIDSDFRSEVSRAVANFLSGQKGTP